MMIEPKDVERTEKIALQEAEALIQKHGDDLCESWLREWKVLKDKIQAGDELRLYASSKQDFDKGMGYSCFMLIREEKVIDEILVAMS